MPLKPFTKTVEETSYDHVVKYKVVGFWSDNQITIIQNSGIGEGVWEHPRISRSCGGHETATHEEQIEAEENFACALLDAVKEAKKLAKRVGSKIPAVERT